MPRFLLLSITALLISASHTLADAAADQFNFAEGLFIQQDYTSAIEEYQAFLKTYATHQKAPTASFRLGECHYRQQHWKPAAAAFQTALKAHPAAPEAHLAQYNLARCHLALKQPTEARTAFLAAAKSDQPKLREESLVGAGECMVQLAQWADATALYADFLKQYTDSHHRPNILFSLGWVRLQAGQAADAIAPLKELLAKHPTFTETGKARLALSDAYTETSNFPEALALLQDMTTGPEAEAAMLRLAWTRYRLGELKQAAEAFLGFVAKYPKSAQVPAACINAGIAYYDLKDYPTAVKTFLALRQNHPKSDEAREMRLWLGISQFHAAQYQAAITEFDALLKEKTLAPDKLGTVAYSRAEAYAALKKYPEAIAAFDLLITDFPESRYLTNAYYSKANAQQLANKLPDAVATLKTMLALELDPKTRENALFAISEYLYRLKQPADVIPFLDQLLKLKGDAVTPPMLYRLGWAQFDTEAWAPAKTTFARLAKLDSPFATEARYMLGRAAENLGQSAEAAAAYEHVIATKEPAEFGEKAFYRLAFLYDLDKAQANLKAYAQRYPKGEHLSAMTLKLAEQRFKAGQIAEAQTMYQTATTQQLPPDLLATAWYGLGWCHLKQDQLDLANTAFAKVTATNAETAVSLDSTLQQAEIAYRQANYTQALKLFDSLKNKDQTLDHRATYMAAWCHLHLEKPDPAATGFTDYLTRYPDGEFFADSSVRLAGINRQQGKFEAARDLLATALEKAGPDLREELLHLYADTLVSLKDWEKLIAISQLLAKEFPQSTQNYLRTFRLGIAYKELGIRDKAEANFRETIASTETIEAAKAQFNIGAMSQVAGEHLPAAKQYLRVDMLYNYPELSPKALFYAIDAFVQAEGKDSARIPVHLAKLRDKYSDSPWTKKAEELMAK